MVFQTEKLACDLDRISENRFIACALCQKAFSVASLDAFSKVTNHSLPKLIYKWLQQEKQGVIYLGLICLPFMTINGMT